MDVNDTKAHAQGYLSRDEFLAAKGRIAEKRDGFMAEAIPDLNNAINEIEALQLEMSQAFNREVEYVGRLAELDARIAELERLEPIARVALRVDHSRWFEPDSPDAEDFDALMNELYGVCSVYRTKINECQATVEQGETPCRSDVALQSGLGEDAP